MPAYPSWSGNASRKICKRIVIKGDLVLLTPTHFGNGDSDEYTNMPLLVDPLDGKTPLLTGASLAGGLRSALRNRQFGLRNPYPEMVNPEAIKKEAESWATHLFGSFRMDEDGEQSPLIVDDSYGENAGFEVRSGNCMNGASHTADSDKLFSAQFWKAGTTFKLRFELLIRSNDDEIQLIHELAAGLEELENSRLLLGARRRRGFGMAQVKKWVKYEYDLSTIEGLINWLEQTGSPQEDEKISTLLGVKNPLADNRDMLELTADFRIPGSFLIRSGGADNTGPDFVFLSSSQPDGQVRPIIPGTSLAGVLRSRALAICCTIGSEEKAIKFVKDLFGDISNDDHAWASRLITCEAVINDAREDLVQFRVSIDRFTGGALDSALFNEQAIWGNPSTKLRLIIRIENPSPAEAGLLLYLLKDLWNADLTVGGERSVGRGRLQGLSASLVWQAIKNEGWSINSINPDHPEKVNIDGDMNLFEEYSNALNNQLMEVSHES